MNLLEITNLILLALNLILFISANYYFKLVENQYTTIYEYWKEFYLHMSELSAIQYGQLKEQKKKDNNDK